MLAVWLCAGIQFDYITPYSMGGNLTLQYQLTPTLSVQAGYVTSLARHLESFPNSNNVTQILDTTQSTNIWLFHFLTSGMARVTPSQQAAATTTAFRRKSKSDLLVG